MESLDEEKQARDRTEEFVSLLGQSQRFLYAYLMSLIHNREIVEEVMQETNLVLWREFENFETGTNFPAWSCRVAFNQVRAWRKKQQRSRLQFSDEFLQAVSDELETHADGFDERLDALSNCISELPDHHQELIRCRYMQEESIEQIAANTQRSTDAVYRMLSRIRNSLRTCVSAKMTTDHS